MYTALEVSNYIINYSNEMCYNISNIKLQNLLYFTQAYYLTKMDKKCFYEKIEAWDFGPVVPEVYKEFCIYGSGTVYVQCDYDIVSEDDKAMIRGVIDKFANYTARDMIIITLNQTPWCKSHSLGKRNEITYESMKNYFTE